MSNRAVPALTREQWEARDYRQSARDLDNWAKAHDSKEDTTEYVAKLGLSESDSVIAMNRSHDRVLIPPPARAALAAFALAEQPFGFTQADVQAVLDAAERVEDQAAATALRDLGRRIQALVPAAA
jgi:hypothetical protein